MVKSNIPVWVGVPEITPPDDKLKPAGKPPEPGTSDQLKGGEKAPPVATKLVAGYTT